MMPKIVSLKQWTPADQQAVCDSLAKGQVIAYPTDTIYGLGVDVFHDEAVTKLLNLKGRDRNKPVSILYASVEKLQRDFDDLSDFQRAAVRTLLPGKVTLLLPLADQNRFPHLFSVNGFIGVRVVDLPELNRILSVYPHPISTTSANPAGAEPARSAAEIRGYFPDGIGAIIDNGMNPQTMGSVIIRLNREDWEIVREGAIPTDRIDELLKQCQRDLYE